MNFNSSNFRKGPRKVVDPKAWELSEVGCAAEGKALFGRGGVGEENKVSSVRSSLFRRNVTSKINTASKATTVDDAEVIFKNPKEAGALQAPFSFEGNTSLALCDYGKINKKVWTKDILALVHNAVRSELNDLISLLMSAKKIGTGLQVRDFANMRKWWQVCSSIVLDFLDLEVKVLTPWFQGALDKSKSEEKESREMLEMMPRRQGELRDLLMSISRAFGDVCDPPAVNMAKPKNTTTLDRRALLVVNSLDALISQVCEYMWEQEMRLPPMLTNVYKSERKERDVIIKRLLTHVTKSSRKADIMLVLLTRWISESKYSKALTKLLVEATECTYSSLQSQFEVNHAGFVHQFKVKADT